jgi:hypothetical protein
MGVPHIGTLLIILQGALDIAKLTVQPSTGVHQTTKKVNILPLFCFRDPLVQYVKRLGIVPQTPVFKTEEGQAHQLVITIMVCTENRQTLLTECTRPLKIPLPVGLHAQPQQILGQGVPVSFTPADPQ